jgi:hypothetical protein
MEYHAMIFEVPPGPDGLDELNQTLQKWAAARWLLHSQSMTVVSTGINHNVLAMIIFQRDRAASQAAPPTAAQ